MTKRTAVQLSSWAQGAIKRAVKARRELRKLIEMLQDANEPSIEERNAEKEYTQWIEHLRAGKLPPAPPHPWIDMLFAKHKMQANFEIAEFRKAQAR